ncbi:MAG: hypothetical protein PHN55_08855, partial [Dysgonamonadaceae bacterium]|nr:hypothetical protein [Dysgonamonadaceae bacterium]
MSHKKGGWKKLEKPNKALSLEEYVRRALELRRLKSANAEKNLGLDRKEARITESVHNIADEFCDEYGELRPGILERFEGATEEEKQKLFKKTREIVEMAKANSEKDSREIVEMAKANREKNLGVRDEKDTFLQQSLIRQEM